MADSPASDRQNRIDPALAMLEYSSIAAGIQAADAMVKRAEMAVVQAGTVQPGRLLVLLGGAVAEIEEALKVGLQTAADTLTDHIFLPMVDQRVVGALAGKRHVDKLADNIATGIVETRTVPAAIHAADRGVKSAEVALMEMRLADGLGGKGIVFFTGSLSDVEAALAVVDETLSNDQQIRQVIIPQLHPDLANVLEVNSRFGMQLAYQFYGVKNIRLDG